MKKIEFRTGRCYGELQYIRAIEVGCPYEEFDFFDYEKEQKDPEVLFQDPVRMIAGRLKFCRCAKTDILRDYDQGGYENISDQEFETMWNREV